MASWLEQVRFDHQGLIPAIAQDAATGRILMVAWMNQEALQLTASRRQAIYWSRSRQSLWHKGEQSGHTQQVQEIRLDCDGDVIVLQVVQAGGIACHTGRESCFYQVLTPQGWQVVDAVKKDPTTIYAQSPQVQMDSDSSSAIADHTDSANVLTRLADIMQARKYAHADESYIASLYKKGLDKILKKVGEEATETVMAAKDAERDLQAETRQHLVAETADLWFHTLVMLGHFNIPPQAVLDELQRRTAQSGLAEKAARS